MLMFGILLSGGIVDAQKKLSHDECKKLVKDGLLHTFIDQRFNNHDGTFPKKISEIIIAGAIPTTFTLEHVKACGRGEFNQSDAQEDELSFELVHGDGDQKGYIKITAIRANYEQIKSAYNRQFKQSFWTATTAQEWFDLLQLDQQ